MNNKGIGEIHNRKARTLIALLLLAASLVLLWRLGGQILMQPHRIQGQDFGQIWAAGRLTLAGENPYNPRKIQSLKNKISGTDDQPVMVSILYSPPWVMPLVVLFSLPPYLAARLIWLLFSIVIILISASFIWSLYGGSSRKRWIAWLVVFTFSPVYALLGQGQITIWILLGLVGFLYADKQENDFLMGFSAALISIKPQLLFLFWPAFLFWCIKKRRWSSLLTFMGTIIISSLIALAFNNKLLLNNINILLHYTSLGWKTPNIGTYLRMVFGLGKFWMQFLPAVIGFAWFLFYWYRNQESWNWKKEMPKLIFVSLLTTPFGWTYDLILLIPGILLPWIALIRSSDRLLTALLAGAYWIVNLIYLFLHRSFTDEFFGWFLPLMILWVWLARKILSHKRENFSTIGFEN